MGLAKAERAALCDLFDELGPDQPTLCTGWQTRDLAAHLVIRERRPDSAVGILVKPLAGYTRKVQDGYAARPWDEVVGLIRSGPPRIIPGKVDELINSTEYFVHHEDVRRGQPDWQPRPPDPARDEVLWAALGRAGKMMLRHSPVGVLLRRPDTGAEIAANRGPNPVTVAGAPGELLMFAFGRDAARVDFDGEQSAIAALQGVRRGL